MVTTSCQFLNSVNLGDGAKPDFEFSEMICTSTENPNIYSQIENSTTGAEFFVQKTLTYGEAMILWFLTLFAFYLIFKTVYNYFWGK